jgi:hypothetical protein
MNERQAGQQVARSLGEMLAVPATGAALHVVPKDRALDGIVKVGKHVFAIDLKSAGDATHVRSAIDHLRAHVHRLPKGAIPLVVVPYMGQVGSDLCEEAGIGWLDLSGNAHIAAPGIHVHVEGRANRFKRRGRPASAFAPKSSRIARWLLIHSDKAFSQRELSKAIGLDEGLTSRVVKRLERDGLVKRDDVGAVRAANPALLLDAWREAYDFDRHEITRGHVAARSGDALLSTISGVLERRKIEHAATGLGAAWLWSRFAAFRIVMVYLREPAPDSVLREIGFREEARGANVSLVVPNDEGVFQGASERDDIECVHPVQIYLDLKDHPERSDEAAQRLRADVLRWGRDA